MRAAQDHGESCGNLAGLLSATASLCLDKVESDLIERIGDDGMLVVSSDPPGWSDGPGIEPWVAWVDLTYSNLDSAPTARIATAVLD